MTAKNNVIRQHVLQALEAQAGKSVSGSSLSRELSVSRAAIWKAIEDLRAEGYPIKASTNKGYTLSPQSDLLSPQGVAAHLLHRELANNIHTYDSLESTNITAKQLAAAGAPHGTVVAASLQTAGRGRLGRSFYSPPNLGVYLSVILRPESMVPELSGTPVLITTAASVAVARAIERVAGKRVSIKWVNDLYLDGKKVCGILTEGVTNFETGLVESIVVGVGINCFQPEEGYPPELADKVAALFPFPSFSSSGHSPESEATSGPKTPLKPEAVPPLLGDDPAFSQNAPVFTKNRLIAAVTDCLMDIQKELPGSRFIEEYKNRCFILGKEILFSPGDGRGIAVDIDSQGGLIVLLPDGSRRTLSTGEISVRPMNS